uniref:AT07028p n=1 Tax=Drosophila melanogaster TaxID=7227 RepID=Q5BHV2_DROME|nr:AT07028p [Drosophila melanogaster]
MPHKKFPRMSQAQLKRLIKSQNQNIAKAACILEPPKIIQQPSMRQSIIPPNPAYSKKQGKNAARPNSERAGKVPMQGLNHVVPEDTVKQHNQSKQMQRNRRNPSSKMQQNGNEASKQEKPNQHEDKSRPKQLYSSVVANKQDGPTAVNAPPPKEGSSVNQIGSCCHHGNVSGEKQKCPDTSSSSATFTWPSQSVKSQGFFGTSDSSADPFSMQNLKKIARDFFSYPEFHPPEASENIAAANGSKKAEPSRTKSQPGLNSSPRGSALGADRSGHPQSTAGGTNSRRKDYPLEEAFMTVIRNLRENYPGNDSISSSNRPNIQFDNYQSAQGFGYGSNSYYNAQSTSAYGYPPTGFPMSQQSGFMPKYNQMPTANGSNLNQPPLISETYQAEAQQHPCWPVYIPEYVSHFMFGEPQDANASCSRNSNHGNKM